MLAIDAEMTKQLPVLSQRHHKERANAAEIDSCAGHGLTFAIKFGVGEIVNLKEPLAAAEKPLYRSHRMGWILLEELGKGWRGTTVRRGVHALAIIHP